MKIIHTADWHLGKLVNGVHMTEDQAYILKQLINAIKKEKPDCVIIAGDIYDRAVPPTEAVQLLNKTLAEIILDLKIPIIAIGGNHDSPSRLDFGTGLMESKGLYLKGGLDPKLEPIILEDEFGEVHFHLIPYSDPSTVRYLFEDDAIKSHDDAMRKITDEIKKKMDKNARHVAISHAFVTPYGEEEKNTSESERPLSIGGAEYVSAQHFKAFDYTALGHLHRAHKVHNETVRYSGSLLKYSQSEENHEKGFYLIEIDEQGQINAKKNRLIPKRDLRSVTGFMNDILTHDKNEDYVFVNLLDETPVISPMEKIRTVYPNAMHISRQSTLNYSVEPTRVNEKQHILTPLEKYELFFKKVKGTNLTSEQLEIIHEIMNELLLADREVNQEVNH